MGSHPTRAMTKPSAKIVHEGEKEISTKGTTKDDEGPRSETELLRRHAPQLCGSASAPHRISLRLRLGFCDSPSRGDVPLGAGRPARMQSLRLVAGFRAALQAATKE